jgi:hypothetical protein
MNNVAEVGRNTGWRVHDIDTHLIAAALVKAHLVKDGLAGGVGVNQILIDETYAHRAYIS